MPRIARIVGPGLSHHPPSPFGYGVTSLTQRGNRRMQTFFGDEDYGEYLSCWSNGAAGTAIACLFNRP